MEVRVDNYQINKVGLPWDGHAFVGQRRIGKEGEVTYIVARTVTNEVHRGSCNYAETVVRGMTEYKYREYTALSARRFPKLE